MAPERLRVRVSRRHWSQELSLTLAGSDRLSYGSLLLLFGRLADVVGSKRMFLFGTGFFTIWCVPPSSPLRPS